MLVSINLVLSACAPENNKITYVPYAEYGNHSKCWDNNDGRLRSFAVFEQGSEGYFVSFISFKCAVSEKGLTSAQARYISAAAFKLSESTTNLSEFGFSSQKIYANYGNEFSLPRENAKVYFIDAIYKLKNDKAEIHEFKSVINTGMNVEKMLEITDDQLHEIGKRFILKLDSPDL